MTWLAAILLTSMTGLGTFQVGQAATQRTPPSVSIVVEQCAQSSQTAWLQFLINAKSGAARTALPTTVIDEYLTRGRLELRLPTGTTEYYDKTPRPLSDLRNNSDLCMPKDVAFDRTPQGTSFENYSSVPRGPLMRIPLETLRGLRAKGQYSLTWRSGETYSNALAFTWDGRMMVVGAIGEFTILRCVARSEQTVHFAMIVVQTEIVANLVLNRLKAGEPFERLVEEYSTDASKTKRGDMGEYGLADLRDEFRSALQGIQAGEFTGIIRLK